MAASYGSEKDLLVANLDAQREHILEALEGLSDEQLRRPVLPTGWNCLGLVQHLTQDVELYWFAEIFAGQPARHLARAGRSATTPRRRTCWPPTGQPRPGPMKSLPGMTCWRLPSPGRRDASAAGGCTTCDK